MEETKPIFLADSNTFITPYRNFYPFDLAPRFWQDVEREIINGKIVILDKVYDELRVGEDELSAWLSNIDALALLTHKTPEIMEAYSEIISYMQTSGLYNSKALAEWSDARVADPWLVACAMVNSYTVVTFETPNANLSAYNQTSRPKIPDICKAFNVAHANLYDMMRSLLISLS